MGLTIALLGIGTIGKAILPHLLESDNEIKCYNRTESKLDSSKFGEIFFKNPAATVLDADIILSCVSDDNASTEIWFGPNGASTSMSSGTVCIELSTLSVQHIRNWADQIYNQKCKAIACPITGSRKGATEGKLHGFLGCKENDLNRSVNQVLEIFISRFYPFTSPEEAMKFKLIYNAIGAGILGVFCEGLSALCKVGIDPTQAVHVLKNVGWGTSVAISKGDAILQRDHSDVSFFIQLMDKDLHYANQLLAEIDGEKDYLKVSQKIFSFLSFNGHSESDISAAIEYFQPQWSEND